MNININEGCKIRNYVYSKMEYTFAFMLLHLWPCGGGFFNPQMEGLKAL